MATKSKKSPDKRETPSKKPARAPVSSRPKKTSGKSQPASSAKSSPPGSKGAGKKAAADASDADDKGRRPGIRGAAPWAARHAAKHAAEARARAAEPPPPGSARATLRIPTGAEQLKARVVELHNALQGIKALRKSLSRNFYAIGLLLRDIRERKLYEARGFGSFEAFLDREVEIGKTTSLRLTRVVEVFHEEAALEYGMDHVLQALATLEAGQRQQASAQPAVGAPPPLPLRPPIPKK